MKHFYSSLFKTMLAAMVIISLSITVTAQRTVVIEDGTLGGINKIILGDTTDDGARVDTNTVYVLKRNRMYLMSGTLELKFPLTLVAEDGAGARPMLVPGVVEGGESQRPFKMKADLRLKGLYVTNMDIGGKMNTKMIRASADNIIIDIDDCVLEYDAKNFVRLDGANCVVKIRNSILGNLGNTGYPSYGRVIDDRGNDVDTVIIENCTIYNATHRVTRDDGGIMKYYRINNNTIFNVGGPVFQIGEVIHAELYNNIVYNYGFYGSLISPDFRYGRYIINIDSLGQDYIDDGYTQVVRVHHNSFYLDSAYTKLEIWGDSIEAYHIFDSTTLAFMKENGDSATNIIEMIPFVNPPKLQTEVVSKYWELGPKDPGIPWFDTTGAPYVFDFPDTCASATAGTDGSQLGDPRWKTYTPEGIFSPENNHDNGLQIYPNPVTNVLHVTTNGSHSNVVTIYSVIGAKMFSFKTKDVSFEVPVNQLKNGIYILSIKNENGQLSRMKFIKK